MNKRDEKEMLAAIGMDSVDRLFDDIPANVRANLDALPRGMDELSVKRRIESILAKNKSTNEIASFLGGGAYDFYVPAAVRSIVSRSEFITSYTPYQPELSQGMNQSLFEYQSLMSELMGMDVVNNSIYDFATALGEAALMTARLSKGKVFMVPEAMSDTRMRLLENYTKGAGIHITVYKYDEKTGCADIDDLKSRMSDDVIGIYVETPNLFGVLEERVDEIREIAGEKMLVAGVNALSLAIVRPPGDYGADIAISDGQMLGNPLNYGGPYLGILACNKKHVRKMPGRVMGMTSDIDGRRAFCMTLMTREQHIRREKATSNICTNEALTAIATAVYMTLQGGDGLRKLAVSAMHKSRKLASRINEIQGCKAPAFDGSYFNEFTVRLPKPSHEIIDLLLKNGVMAGVPLSRHTKGMENDLLVAVSDKTTDADMNALVDGLKEVTG